MHMPSLHFYVATKLASCRQGSHGPLLLVFMYSADGRGVPWTEMDFN